MSQDIKENMISQQETKEQFQLLEDLERFKSQSYQAATEILQAGKVKPGQLFVVGCSTSEVCGGKIGTASSPKAAQAVFEGIWKAAKEKGVWLAAQCCEHLNRALILEQEAADQYLMNVKKMADAKRIAVCKPSVTESKTPTVVPVNSEERKKTHKYGWVQDNQRKLIHG